LASFLLRFFLLISFLVGQRLDASRHQAVALGCEVDRILSPDLFFLQVAALPGAGGQQLTHLND
jgi:hypothetical protein